MLIALGGASTLTGLGVLLGIAALLGLWVQARGRQGLGVHRHTVALGGGQALHVVELEGRRLVIGTGPGAAPRLLTELSPEARDARMETGPDARHPTELRAEVKDARVEPHARVAEARP